MMKRLLFATLLIVAAVTTVTAQNSFIVADKNGNSQLVQSLIFQQQQNGFTWKADDSKTGDIKDLLFIARTNQTLSSGTAADVTAMLEELSGTDKADAEAVAAALQDNPNVEEAYSADGNNVVVKTGNSNGYVMYPMYETISPFEDGSIELPPTEATSKKVSSVRRASSGSMGKVAIFNFFDEQPEYFQQNIIVGYIKSKFEEHDYNVKLYGRNNLDGKEIFTQENFEAVINNSSQYKAIIIMSHGGLLNERKSYIATRDEPLDGGVYYHEKVENIDYRMIPVEESLRNVSSNCIVYIGACDGVPNGGFWEYSNSFPRNTGACAIAWSGKNCIAQAHAALFFHYLLYDGWDVAQALTALPKKDPISYVSQRHFSQYGGDKCLDGKADLRPQFAKKVEADLTAQCYVKKTNGQLDKLQINWRLYSDFYPRACRVSFKNVLTGYVHEQKGLIVNSNEDYVLKYDLKNVIDGAHDVSLEVKEGREWKRVRLHLPAPVLVSKNFNPLYALPEVQDEDVATPQILGTDDQPLEEITLAAGNTQTYTIGGYAGHTFNAVSLDTDIATVSVSGNTLTVTAVKEGQTYIGVQDAQNKQMAVAEVTVTAGGGDIVAYTSCPDGNHPHLIDLGLPSGTKWACCNVGASKPEDRGGYYAWGETTEKSTYTSDNYLDGKGRTYYIGSDIAGTQYDAATANWGSPWVMPSKEQCKELDNNCTSEWTTENGVNGRRFTSPNGASIFLPAAGFRDVTSLRLQGSYGSYFSSSLSESETYYAYELGFYSGSVYTLVNGRYFGRSVRPVRKN